MVTANNADAIVQKRSVQILLEWGTGSYCVFVIYWLFLYITSGYISFSILNLECQSKFFVIKILSFFSYVASFYYNWKLKDQHFIF